MPLYRVSGPDWDTGLRLNMVVNAGNPRAAFRSGEGMGMVNPVVRRIKGRGAASKRVYYGRSWFQKRRKRWR